MFKTHKCGKTTQNIICLAEKAVENITDRCFDVVMLYGIYVMSLLCMKFVMVIFSHAETIYLIRLNFNETIRYFEFVRVLFRTLKRLKEQNLECLYQIFVLNYI